MNKNCARRHFKKIEKEKGCGMIAEIVFAEDLAQFPSTTRLGKIGENCQFRKLRRLESEPLPHNKKQSIVSLN